VSLVIPSRLWEYFLASGLIIRAPGPSVLFTIARAISWGRAVAVATVLGNALGMFTISILVALGLGPLLQRSHPFYIAVQWLGAFYLVYLGTEAIRHSREHAESMTDLRGGKPSLARTIREGYLVGVLNPKSLVFFAAILPQFIDRKLGHLTSQLLLLGAIFCVICFFSDGTWGIVAGSIRSWLSSDPARLVHLRTGGGVVMVALGAFTFINSLLHA
jgi:threonine/homoserine/homoserine lactone efflux protein